MSVSEQEQSGAMVQEGLLSAPLMVSSRAQEVADRLLTAIAVGEYLPGARLPPERELATSLGVGRMTVREAIAQVASHGMIQTRRGRHGGSYVTHQWEASSREAARRTLGARWDSLREVKETLCLLNGALARSAAQNRTPDDVEILRASLEAFRAAPSGTASQAADAAPHTAISTAAHNALLDSLLKQVETQLNLAAPSHPWGPVESREAMEERSLIDHQKLVTAICAQNALAAETIGREHIRIDLDMIEAVLTKTFQE